MTRAEPYSDAEARAATPSEPQALTDACLVGVVFSRDRALQLEALLDSLASHCEDPSSLTGLHVLHTGTSPRFKRQYEALERRWQGPMPVTFRDERRFRRELLAILGLRDRRSRRAGFLPRALTARLARAAGGTPVVGAPWDYLLFLVDDNVFVRAFSLAAALHALRRRPQAIGFSLRLGRNTTYCYPHAATQIPPPFAAVAPGVLAFDWPGAQHDFGYPFEVSSSIYPAATIAGLLATLDYSNPNTLEEALALATRRYGLSRERRELCCFETSVTFCNAVNKVQTTLANRSGDSPALSAAALADLFDAGMRIDTEALTGFLPNGCHGDVPFAFVPRTRDEPG